MISTGQISPEGTTFLHYLRADLDAWKSTLRALLIGKDKDGESEP